MLLHYFEITMRSKQARVNIESWVSETRDKLLHSHSVPEEDNQATKKTSVIVTEEKLLRKCTNRNTSFVSLLLYYICLKTWPEIVNSIATLG